jgi:hypothetical protein
MTYGLHVAEVDYYYKHFGVRMSSGKSFFEIPAETDRFKALVWSAGCQYLLINRPYTHTPRWF